MNRTSLFLTATAFALTLTTAGAMEPMSFKELSMEVRNRIPEQSVLDDVARRRLARALTPAEESILSQAGASATLVAALRSPALLAGPGTGKTPPTFTPPSNFTPAPPVQPSPEPTQATAPKLSADSRFATAIEVAKTARPQVLHASDAFSLSQLDQAKAKAQAEGKPLGFVMVWGQFFEKLEDTRSDGGASATTHFYQAFHDNLVLVFVRHETELDRVPAAVKQGFTGPDEGGYAPNMAVVDATASEFIVEIPLGGGDADGKRRDEVFSAGAAKIEHWLASHPGAMPQPKAKTSWWGIFK